MASPSVTFAYPLPLAFLFAKTGSVKIDLLVVLAVVRELVQAQLPEEWHAARVVFLVAVQDVSDGVAFVDELVVAFPHSLRIHVPGTPRGPWLILEWLQRPAVSLQDLILHIQHAQAV
eukprot:950880-Rhodomonas_salina.2